MFDRLIKLPRKPLLWLISLYQKVLSPDHGLPKIYFPHGYCKFVPTCSRYAYETIDRHGIFKGVPLAIWRVLRCNPCSRGGIDPI